MLLVNFAKVSKDYGGNTVFDQVDLEIVKGERIGLVGENGAGKSTLLKLMAGRDTPTEGTISRKRGLTIGYLSQEIDPRQSTKTVFEVVTEVSAEFTTLLARLHTLETQMADLALTTDAMTQVLESYARAQESFEAMGGYMVEHRAKSVLSGLLQYPQTDHSSDAHVMLAPASPGGKNSTRKKPERSGDFAAQQVGTLSGGEKKLVNLARILVQTPDLLLLDEPDNHLDMAAKAWLEQYIHDYPGTVVIISHDRHLLDHTVKKIFQLEDGSIDIYHGNYSYYVTERQKRLTQRYEDYMTQQDEIKRLEASLHQLKEWARLNDKFSGRMHNMEKRIERIKEDLAQRPTLARNTIKVQLDAERSGKKVLEIKGLSQSISERVLFQPFDLTVLYGERVGIVGENGSGKSTLLKVLLGILPPTRGTVKIGASVVPGYYAQEQETLPLDSTPLDFVSRLKRMNEGQAIGILHRLLFSYRAMHTTIRYLSGGEKSRLQIARLMLTEANFLLLDEPTNNLDIASIEVLESALQQFTGTVVMVSHDRYFLDKLATKIVALRPDRSIKLYPGNFSYYMEHQYAETKK